MLGPAQEDVPADGSTRGDEEFAVGVVEGEGNVVFGTGVHELGGGNGVPTETDDTFEIVEGDAEFDLTINFDGDSGPVFFEEGVLGGDEEGVEMLAHYSGVEELGEPITDATFKSKGFGFAMVDEGAGVAAAGGVFGEGGDAGADHLTKIGCGGDSEFAESFGEGDFGATFVFSIEEEAGWDGDF